MQKKNFIYAILCIGVAFLISGCGTKNNKEQGTQTPAPMDSTVISSTLVPDQAELTVVPLETMEITIYSLNPDSMEKEAVTALVTVESELTPELIVEQVVAAMEDEGFFIGINDIIIQGDSVTIDYKADAAPVCEVGASVEGTILDIIGQSILDNLPQYKKIYVSIEGNAYKTGHLEFELDEVYIGR